MSHLLLWLSGFIIGAAITYLIIDMKKIKLHETKEFQIDNVRVTEKIYRKVEEFSKENGVSMQVIVIKILENFIDEIIFE